MSDSRNHLVEAREAYRNRRWPEAYELFVASGRPEDLAADDAGALSESAWWLGRVDDSVAAGATAFRAYVQEGRTRPAAMTAVGVAVSFLLRGDELAGRGWIGRASRLLDEDEDCPEAGYLTYFLQVEGALDGPDPDGVIAAAGRVRELGRRHSDPNLTAIGLLGEGRIRIRCGQVRTGMTLLDEAMVQVLEGDVAPDWAGNIYCHLMSACHELADLHRARLWVRATTTWLESLPAAVLFTGICRVHRSQVLLATGAWTASEREAATVCSELAGIAALAAAEGHYQLGELARLRGDLPSAERSYRRAHQLGRSPQPGLALLRLAQGRVDAAAASARAALFAEATRPLARARLLTAAAEIALAARDLPTATDAVDELTEIATAYESPGFTAAAHQWRGAVLLAAGRHTDAIPVLHTACQEWHDLEAPYDCARVRVLLAQAYRSVGDDDDAELELTAASEVFTRLGARLDAAALAPDRTRARRPAGLTDREAEVLTLLAAGHSNREMAAALVISERTVARHLSNIFTKLDLRSRTAVASWAHRHGMAG
jgi:DNA-binding CsgD family transcriptional regulator